MAEEEEEREREKGGTAVAAIKASCSQMSEKRTTKTKGTINKA